MVLADALLPIAEADIRNTYLCSPRLGIDDTRTGFSLQLLERTSDGAKVICLVFFQTDTGEPILDQHLERWLCNNKKLFSQPGRSRVAYRVRFYIRGNFQRKGFAHYISIQEEQLFKRWGATEIQTTAMDDGRWVWTREKFGYRIPVADFQLLQQRYVEWQRELGRSEVRRADSLADFPKEFLLSAVNSFPLFKGL
ncbi:MAG TPA: hypothetical protein VFL34_02950 [Candidatus Sulfotelmatobacter sp.]|nr:hypothetical protein [Candidatus Sulfotelmatobacter sp.]